MTHAAPTSVRLQLGFTFVTDGLASAIAQAKAKAKAGDKDVVVMGGGDVIRQTTDAGLVDELRIHLAPIVLGSGTPLFSGSARHQLVQRSVKVSTTATHLTYSIASP